MYNRFWLWWIEGQSVASHIGTLNSFLAQYHTLMEAVGDLLK